MNGRRMTDRHLSKALRAHLPERAQAGLRRRIVDAVETTPQQRPLPSVLGRAIALGGLDPSAGRVRPNRWTLVLVAAAVLTLIVASAIFVGRQRPSLLAVIPAPTSTSTSTETPTPTPTAITPSPSPTAEVSPPVVNQSPILTWTKVDIGSSGPTSAQVAWLVDRFVLVDEDADTVSTSPDGVSWHVLGPGDPDPGYADLLKGSFVSWQDHVVGLWNPEDRDGPEIAGGPPITARDILQIVRPPAERTETTPFKGRIESIGIGPMGIVAQVHSHLDWDAWVTKKLGLRTNNDWTCCVKDVTFQNGVLQIKLNNRPGLKVVWADEGLEPGDYQDRGLGWYSPDGEHWTGMAPNDHPTHDSGSSLPTGAFGSVVGVSDGFIATGAYPDGACADPNGSCTGMWYSSDGLTWRLLGTAPEIRPSERELCIRDGCSVHAGELLPWRGGALMTGSDGRLTFWTSGGSTELPMAAQADGTVATGPLGLVSIGDGQLLFTRDGIDWDLQPMPAEMAAVSSGRPAPTVAVGERSVLIMLWSGSFEKGYVPSLWRGAPAP